MIKAIDAANQAAFLEFAGTGGAFGSRMISYALAYGFGLPEIQFWMQTREEAPCAVLSKVDGDMTLFLDPVKADGAELESFINAVGFSSLLCPKNGSPPLESLSAETGFVMEQTAPLLVPLAEKCTIVTDPEFPALFQVLNGAQSDWVSVKDYALWYVDLNHKIRHGAALASALQVEDGAMAACVLLTAIAPESVVMGGVATLPEYRRRGYASMLISYLTGWVRQQEKQLFLLREAGKNEAFYHGLGFQEREEWILYRR